MPKAAHLVEVVSVAVIAIAILFGGQAFLGNLARFPAAAGALLALVVVLVTASLWRERRLGTLLPVRATRDSAFLAAALLAIVYIVLPQRWSLGATIAMVEFALVLELVALVAARGTAH